MIFGTLMKQLLSKPATNPFPVKYMPQSVTAVLRKVSAGPHTDGPAREDRLRQGEVHRMPVVHPGLSGECDRVLGRGEEDPYVRRALHLLRAMRRCLSGRCAGDDGGVPRRRRPRFSPNLIVD